MKMVASNVCKLSTHDDSACVAVGTVCVCK